MYEVAIFQNWSIAVILGITNPLVAYTLIAVQIFPVIAVNVCPDKVITKFFGAPGICESDQKFVTPLVIHTIVAVPGLADVLRIFHEEGSKLPVIACTSHPLRVKLSNALALLSVVNVIVSVVSVRREVAAVISFITAYATQLHDLNFRLFGKVKITVAFVWLAAKSLFACSCIVILPIAVHHDPTAELAALSAEIFVPLFAEVTNTVK